MERLRGIRNPTYQKAEKYANTHPIRANMTLSLLHKLQPFIEAWASPMGQAILDADITRHEELLIKIYEETATPKELAEFRYLKGRIREIAGKIVAHKQAVQEIMDDRDEKKAV